jgi:hypothetical protein
LLYSIRANGTKTPASSDFGLYGTVAAAVGGLPSVDFSASPELGLATDTIHGVFDGKSTSYNVDTSWGEALSHIHKVIRGSLVSVVLLSDRYLGQASRRLRILPERGLQGIFGITLFLNSEGVKMCKLYSRFDKSVFVG